MTGRQHLGFRAHLSQFARTEGEPEGFPIVILLMTFDFWMR
jgi:hypothetical protein